MLLICAKPMYHERVTQFWTSPSAAEAEEEKKHFGCLANVGGPIRLLCENDVIHRNNGAQESWAIEAVCRRLGYAGLKPASEKAVRSFANSRDVLRAWIVNCEWKVWMPVRLLQSLSVAERARCFFPGSSFLGDRNLQGRWSLQWCVSGRRYHVPQ